MIDNQELPNYGRISGKLHLDSARRARMMQTQQGVAETLKLPDKAREPIDRFPRSSKV